MTRSIASTVLALQLTLWSTAQSQHATFVGLVADSATGLPLATATVSIQELELLATTDDAGTFTLPGIETGEITVFVRHVGYEPWAIRFRLNVTKAMTVDIGPILLTRQVVDLDPITVEGEAFHANMLGFEQRRRAARGTFITADEIAELAPARTSELLRRVHGFRTQGDGSVSSTRGIPSIRNGFSRCQVAFFIDGTASNMPSVDNILPNAIAGIEIYRGASTTPQIFQGFGNPKCGVVAIWTKNGG